MQERDYYLQRSLEDLRHYFLPRFSGYARQKQETIRLEQDPQRLSENAWKILVRIASHPEETIEERMEAIQ